MKIMACNKVKTVSDYLEVRNMYGYIPLGKSIPKNTRVKIKWRCPEDHIILMSYQQILRILTDFNVPCRICNPLLRYGLDSYMEFKEKYGYTPLIETTPDSINYSISWECPKKHKFQASFYSVRKLLTINHIPCQVCASASKKLNIETYREVGEKKGLKLISPEIKTIAGFPHKWECSKGHLIWKSFTQVKRNDVICTECRKPNPQLYELKVKFSEMVGGEVNFVDLGVTFDIYFIRGNHKICVFFSNKRSISLNNNLKLVRITKGYKSLTIYHKTEIPNVTELQKYVESLDTEDHATIFHLEDPFNF